MHTVSAVSAKRYDVRIVVGTAGGPRSSMWHYWSRNDHVYVAHAGFGGIEKFSFHPPNVCRRAFTKEHGTPPSLTNRATHEWRRDPTPSPGTGKVVRVLRGVFWTDVLSTAIAPERKEPMWIDPAPKGHNTVIDLMFTRDDEATVRAAISASEPGLNHKLISYRQLANGEAFCIASLFSASSERPIRITASHEDIIVSPLDPMSSGRPVRVTTFSKPKDGDFFQAWEWGAYAVAPPLTDEQWEALRNV